MNKFKMNKFKMYKFKMFARYEDGFEFETIDNSESDCMSNITSQILKHGSIAYYTACNGYDEKLNCYWVYGEYFSSYDEYTGMFIR